MLVFRGVKVYWKFCLFVFGTDEKNLLVLELLEYLLRVQLQPFQRRIFVAFETTNSRVNSTFIEIGS